MLAALVLLVVLADHLRQHPHDLDAIRTRLARDSLNVVSIRRSRAVWRYHYRRGAWPLSRFARFYRVDVATGTNGARELIAAIDPWRPRNGVQIL